MPRLNPKNGKVGCVVPSDIQDQYGAGNWKDVNSVNQALEFLGFDVSTVGHLDGESKHVLQLCEQGVSDLIVHYSFWPELIESVRRSYPEVRIHTRMHNAEALQHLHRRAPGLWPSVENLRGWYGAVKLFQRDSRCRSLSDNLLCISEWDAANYHRRLFGSARLFDVPYFSPWPRIRPDVRPLAWEGRRNSAVCLAGGRDRIGRSLRDSLMKIASYARTTGVASDWQFEISSGARGSMDSYDVIGDLVSIGDVSEPWDLLCKVKAVAVITSLGYGCKTTIVDALAAGCNVIVDARMASRLSPEVRGLCIEVSMDRPDTFRTALEAAARRPLPSEINQLLERKAVASLSMAIGGLRP